MVVVVDVVVTGARWDREPVGASVRPILPRRFDSEPVFFSWRRSGGCCRLWSRVYCSCKARCLRSSSRCLASSNSALEGAGWEATLSADDDSDGDLEEVRGGGGGGTECSLRTPLNDCSSSNKASSGFSARCGHPPPLPSPSSCSVSSPGTPY